MATVRRPQQAATIAIRRKGRAIEVCLIRRRGSYTWGIPKGTIDPGYTPEETALNEAWEEAGLEGRLLGNAIGTYEYEKWYTTLRVAVFVMEVVEEHAEWLESDIRVRRWTSLAQASSLLAEHPARPLLNKAASRRSRD
jgi:8-oxo-dGTP pyrophosphatase MutT (NUDIX family)